MTQNLISSETPLIDGAVICPNMSVTKVDTMLDKTEAKTRSFRLEEATIAELHAAIRSGATDVVAARAVTTTLG